MVRLSELFRKATTFLLALFLWFHALFFLNIHSVLLSKWAETLRLAPSEALLFALLLMFSFLTASGFWKTLLSLVYIYFFPFVLLGYLFLWFFRVLRAMNRWFKAQATPPGLGNALVIGKNTSTIASVPSGSSANPAGAKKSATDILRFLLRPFRRFMLLWCILLLVTTHAAVVWLCLIVVLAQLARQIFVLLKLLVFSPWVGESLKKLGSALLTPLNNALVALTAVTRDASPTNELRNLFNQLKIWRQILEFLRDPYLLSRWAWVSKRPE